MAVTKFTRVPRLAAAEENARFITILGNETIYV
jgi:hypothetical protein